MRAVDEPIPADEELYREISVSDGEILYMDQIDLQGMSVTRGKYCRPEAIVPGKPERNGLAVITPAELPTDIAIADGRYEFFAKDLPEEGNEPHAEIWPGREPTDERPNGDRDRQRPWAPGRPLREKMKLALARRFRIYRHPTPVIEAQAETPVENEGKGER
jgi:hypothetical protein